MKRLHKPTGIVLHHSATRDTTSVSFDAIKEYHIHEKHWDDIGYHFLIELTEKGFEVFTGRGLQFEGAHTIGRNDMIGICVVGNFDEKAPDPDLMKVLTSVVEGLLMTYRNIKLEDIYYHNETSDKTCPGKLFPSKSIFLSSLFSGRI